MPKYLFVSRRVTEYEDIIKADTQEEAVKIFDELLADDLTEMNQFFEYEIYGQEIK